jgi:hypothetical protein
MFFELPPVLTGGKQIDFQKLALAKLIHLVKAF